MSRLFLSFKLLLLLFLITYPFHSLAKTVDELIKNGELTVTTKLIAPKKIVAKQPITIQIEIATNRWFAKGTRVKTFALEEAVILPISELAINGTKKIKGITWASQIREITLYPMQEGIYDIPAISIEVSINTQNNGIVNGTITTQPFEIETYKPEVLAQIENYLVTSELVVSIEGGFDSTKDYQQGDAVTQTISIIVQGVPAMMITPLIYKNLTGLSVYQKAAEIFDKNTRGSLTGHRVESYTYIFEQAGEYTLPEQVIYWWNNESGTLEIEVIPESSWSVGESVTQQDSLSHLTFMSLIKRVNIGYSLLFFVFVYLSVYLLKHRNILINRYNFITKKNYRVCRNHFINAINNKQWKSACHWLYQASYEKQSIDMLNEDKFIATLSVYYEGNKQKLHSLNKLFQLAYKNNDCTFTLDDAKQLITHQKNNIKFINGTMINKINLNPTK